MTKYSILQRIRIAFWGRIPIERRKAPDFEEYIMFYAFNCPIHGIVENYPHGYNGRLICPKCIENKHEQ